MPDIQPNFEQALESDIEHLSAEVKARRENPEYQSVSHQEILRQSIQTMVPTPPPTNAAPTTDAQNVFQNPLPDYAKDAPPETRLEVEQLLEMAFREGIMKANETATKANPYVLDTFHDALVGKLYPEFQKRGLLQ